MNDQILKRLKKKQENITNYLSLGSNDKEYDYLLENYLISHRRRYTDELNDAINNNLVDKNGYDVVLSSFNQSNNLKLKEICSLSANFGSKNVVDQFLSSSETANNFDLSKLSVNDFLKYQNEELNVTKSTYKPLCHNNDFDFFTEKSASYQKLLNESQNKNFKQKENKAPSNERNFFSKSISNNSNINNECGQNNQSYNVPNNPPQNEHVQNVNFKNAVYKSNSSQSNGIQNYQNSTNSNTNSSVNNSNVNNYNTVNSQNSSNLSINNPVGNGVNNKFSSLRYEPRFTKCYKRRNEDEKEKIDDDGNFEVDTGAFKSAREQLILDSTKQQNQPQQQQQQQSNNYSMKRPMNNPPANNPAKRGVHSKFNLPIRNNNDDQNSNQNQSNMNQKMNSQPGTEIESLKNIDQKLIEIIMSEVMDRTPPITWNDIAGLEFVKKTIKEIVIWPMLRPDIFHGLRGPPKGLLLFGPPGTGKTLIAKCIANESKSTFFSITASTLTSKWQGESEKLVKVLFEVARSYQPAVIFLDEIDSLLSQRSDDDRESSRRLKTEFFIQMDGARTTGDERILLIGATNRPQELDDAARRRFVKKLYIPLPEAIGRKQIVINLMKTQPCELSEDEIDQISELTDGYSGADMTHLCREAAIGPIRTLSGMIETVELDQVREINFQDFMDAMQQVRASVSPDDLDAYVKWNNSFGSVPILNK
ncbi:unnamed protein product [Brachionus calyciflorus]|uniref:AAA+ ATPase domain-containing protein n=1 Tax=Brachionus calyciflorus TaxID=104777 RepID=A0A813MH42_9BILA|nr:unnamed protein product [Brachionus calyciflorus]